MKKVSDLRKFHNELNDDLIHLEQELEFPRHFYQAFLSGENAIYQKSITETKNFEEDWIQTIESYFHSLNKIIMSPKTAIRYEQEVRPIEKAKKVGSPSIRHLSSHSHLIKEITHDNVVPKKILTTETEIEYAIYENRFIKTLVNRLFDFVTDRYDLIKEFADAEVRRHFNMTSDFEFRDSKFKMSFDLEMEESLDVDAVSIKNRQLLARVEHLVKLINSLKKSQFMEEIKNAKPVQPPIMKTQIIMKNVDYKNAYLLWLYLDKYNTLPYEINITEQNLTFDRYFMKNIYQNALVNFTNIIGNQKALEDHYQYLDIKKYSRKTPKISKTHPKDMIEQPDPLTVEDIELNQYYLEQSKKIFEKNLEAYEAETGNYDISLRKALKDTIHISNALFKSYFEFESEVDEDIFTYLVKTDPTIELDDIKQKARVARIIREVKEADYKESIRLEKQLMKQIEKTDAKLIRETKKKIREEAKRAKEEERLKLEKEAAKSNQEILSEHLEFARTQNELLKQEHQALKEKLKEEALVLKAQEKETIEKERIKAREQYQKEVEAIRNKIKREKEKLKAKERAQKERDRMLAKEQRQKMQIKTKEKIALEKERIKRDKETKIKKEQEKLDALK